MQLIALAALLLLAGAAGAEEALPISDVVQQAMSAAVQANNQSSSPIDVKGRGDGLQRALERAKTGKAGKYSWAVETDLRDAAAAKDPSKLINASAKYLKPDGISVPGPTTREHHEYLKAMSEEGRVKIVSNLPPESLATYTPGEKVIRMSEFAVWLCWKMGVRTCAPILYHEAGHGLDEELHHGHGHAPEDMERVIREETKGFVAMQRFGRGAYSNPREGHEMIATTLMELEAEQRDKPTDRLSRAIGYLRTYNEVFSAVDEQGRPDDKKLEKIIRRLYNAAGAPTSTSA